MYKLSCHSSLALVNEEGKASGAFADGACVDGTCVDGACAGGACTDRACAGGACTDGACTDGACAGGACADGACTDGACIGGVCTDGVYNIIYGKSPASVPPGNSRFIYIEGFIRLKILLRLKKAEDLLI